MRTFSYKFAIIALLFCGTSLLVAQNRASFGQPQFEKKSMLDIHAGYLAPKDTETGMLFGAAFLSTFDDAIEWGFGMDVFQKAYAEETEVSQTEEGASFPTTSLTRIDYKSTVIPLYASLKLKIPGLISRRNNQIVLGYFARASLSYQFLISDINNYEDDIKEKRNFKGWGW